MDKETLSNYGWITIVTLVLAVMLALATPFGNFISTAIKSTTQGLFDTNKNALNSTGLINIGDQSFSDGTGGSGGGNQTTEVKRKAGSVIPDGATYTPNGGTALICNGTNTFPETPATGDEYTEGDYTYKYNYYYYGSGSWSSNTSQNGWGVRVNDTSKTTYSVIISEIAGQPVTNMDLTFIDCTSLTTAPTIPNSVTNMTSTFKRCSSLATAPVMPNSVTNMTGTFHNCTSLTTAPTIPNSVTKMKSTFKDCTKLTTPPDMSNVSSVTDMSYTFSGCTSLTTAPVIPNGVTNMDSAFMACTSLSTATAIPSRVTNMEQTFTNCTSLTTPPDMSNANSVTNMTRTFSGCTSLTGTIEINANPTTYYNCFKNTVKPIILTGSSTKLSALAATATNSNVTVQQ